MGNCLTKYRVPVYGLLERREAEGRRSNLLFYDIQFDLGSGPIDLIMSILKKRKVNTVPLLLS